MREILLNGVQHILAPDTDIIQRAINPWKAQVRQTGGREYSDFGQSELEEYFDFRNGIGKNRGIGSDARLEFSEGVDFSVEGQAVLGPLVTTAGSFGVAPVKIIDFQGATYAIGHNLLAKWNTSTEAWDSKDTSLANPIDAIVVTDDTDEYLIVSSATTARYTVDGTTWDKFIEDFTAYTEVGAGLTVTAPKITAANVDTDVDAYVYKDMTADFFDDIDINFEIYIESTSDVGAEAGMAVSNTVGSIKDFVSTDISVEIFDNGNIKLIRGDQTADDTYAGSDNTLYYCTLTRVAGNDTVTLKIYSDAARTTLLDTLTVSGFSTTKYRYIYGFVNRNDGTPGQNFDGYVQNLALNNTRGYLANFENRLYNITTNGKTVRYSTAKNIDLFSGKFTLTGNYGTIYDFFAGKLLSDGSNTLYFCGTEGLYSVDTTNQLAYQQEVSYPPLTNAGNVGIYWNANVWVATGYGILKIAPATATFVGPDQDDGLPAGFQGKVFDFATVNNWLVFCVNGGTTDNSSILKRNSSLGGNLQVYSSIKQHKAADTSNVVTSSDATDQGTLNTLLNEIYGDYNNHIASTTYHISADTSNEVTSPVASSEATAVTLANEIKADYNAHRVYAFVHGAGLGLSGALDTDNPVTTADCSDLATAITLANEIKADYNNHIALLNKAITCIHHSPSSLYTNGRLWFGESKGIKYMMMPDTTSNVKQVSSYTYVDDSGYAKLPIFRNLAMISKTALGIAAVTKSCDSNDYVSVLYGLNGAAPTTALGTFQSSPLPPRLEFNSGLGTEFYTIQFAFRLIRGSTNTNSPELESLIFYYLATPNTISGFQLHIQATLDDAEEKIAAFETIRDTNTLVLFYPSGDATKTAYKVKLTTMPLRFYHEEMQEREGYIQVDLQEIFNG